MIATPTPIVSFAHLPHGWESLGGEGGAVALSWDYRPNSLGWATRMPRDAIAVSVYFLGGRAHYPPLRLVLPKRPATTLEGAPDTPEYRIHGRVDGRDVEVRIDIRRRSPTPRQLGLAQRVVSSIRFA
jgi:hypothetical protein